MVVPISERHDDIKQLYRLYADELTKLGKRFEFLFNDLVITKRYPRKDPIVNRIQSAVYHYIVRKLTGAPFKDITSGLRLINKKILTVSYSKSPNIYR